MHHEVPSFLSQIVRQFLIQSPLILVLLVGSALVIFRWKSLGDAALPAILGLGIMTFFSFAGPVFWVTFPRMVGHSNPDGILYSAASVIQTVFWAGAVLLLVLGVIKGRPKNVATRS